MIEQDAQNTLPLMIMQARGIILITLILSTISCSTSREKDLEIWSNKTLLKPVSPGWLDGRYENESMGYGASLWSIIGNGESKPSDQILISLEGEGCHRISATLIRNSRHVAETEHVVHFKDSYAVLNPIRRQNATPVPFLWGSEKIETAMGITASGSLAVYSVSSGVLMAGPVPTIGGGGGSGYTLQFKRAPKLSTESKE